MSGGNLWNKIQSQVNAFARQFGIEDDDQQNYASASCASCGRNDHPDSVHSGSLPTTPLLPRHLTINAPVTRVSAGRPQLLQSAAINKQLAASQRRSSEEIAAFSPQQPRPFVVVSPTDQLMIDNTGSAACAAGRRNSQ